jgi:hypothetical protein
MNSNGKWISTVAMVAALIFVLYFTGVINSKLPVGVALITCSASLVLFTLVIPPPEDE